MKLPYLTAFLTLGLAVGVVSAQTTTLGPVRITKAVTADGKPLQPGTYQIRVTDEQAKPAVGETPSSERWVEFVRAGQVSGRELATIIPDSEIAQVAEGPGKPARNGSRVDLLKSGSYLRVWVNKGGNNYLVHLKLAG